MRRIILITTLLATAAAALPAPASAATTRIERHDELVGQAIDVAAGRWAIQKVDYVQLATVKRSGSHHLNFTNRDGKSIGHAHSETPGRWDIFLKGHSERYGYIKRASRREWRAYLDESGDSVGSAVGKSPIQGAAAVLIVWGG